MFNVSLLYKLIKADEHRESLQRFLAAIIHVQHVDTTYNSVNFDDPISTLSYFKKIYRASGYSRDSDEVFNENFDNMMYFINLEIATERFSIISAEVEAHQIMRSAAERVHVTFRELKRDRHGDGATSVLRMIWEAQESFSKLALECIVEKFKLNSPSD